MKKHILPIIITIILLLTGCKATEDENLPVEIKVLILPKFEVGELSGDFPGEAQYYYEEYCEGGTEYDVPGSENDQKLYVKDGVALYITGMGKANAAMSLTALLTDERFDFSNAYILSTGCAGSSCDQTVMGDVFLITAAVDYDLGHHVDSREIGVSAESGDSADSSDSSSSSGFVESTEPSGATWFHDESYDSSACKILNPFLMDKAYELTKDIKLETTEKTRAYMKKAFPGESWALRDPQVLRGTTVTGDNYWKGEYGHSTALKIVETYGCPDPYATTEMEDLALAVVADRMGMLDRLLIVRDSVDLDVFMNGSTPESLWDPDSNESLASSDSSESADIFETARKNNFAVGKVLIDAICDQTLAPDVEK